MGSTRVSAAAAGINYSYNLPGSGLKAMKGVAGKTTGRLDTLRGNHVQCGDPLTVTDNRGGSIFGQNGGGYLFRGEIGGRGATYGQTEFPGGVDQPFGRRQRWLRLLRMHDARFAGGTASTAATGFTGFHHHPHVAGTNGTGWGNSGLGTFLGRPGQFNFDADLAKSARVGGIHENATLQFRVEFYNMFNHPQFFRNPSRAYNTSTSATSRLRGR